MAPTDPYRRFAGWYDRVVEPMQTGVRRVALEVVPPQQEWNVLDVGCGTGTGLVPYLDAGCNVTGVDLSPAMLEKAEARLGADADLHLSDGTALPFATGTFDLVTCTLVVHEVAAAARVALVDEMARVTKPSGRLLLTDFRLGSLRGWKGPLLRATSTVIERFSGHYAGYRSYRASGGMPGIVSEAGLDVRREKIVAGGNLGLWVVSPIT